MPQQQLGRAHDSSFPSDVQTILLADDDPSLLSLLATILQRGGHRVIEVDSGIGVLDHVEGSLRHPARHARVDLLITDIHMPGLSGLDAMASLREARCLPRTIVMTGAGNWDECDRALALGAILVLRKPFSIDELYAAVEGNLDKVA